MNPKIETCVNCDHQCRLEQRRDLILKDIEDGFINIDGVKSRMSVMSQKASQDKPKCPNSEIQRVRREIAEKTGSSKLLRIVNANSNYSINPKTPM